MVILTDQQLETLLNTLITPIVKRLDNLESAFNRRAENELKEEKEKIKWFTRLLISTIFTAVLIPLLIAGLAVYFNNI